MHTFECFVNCIILTQSAFLSYVYEIIILCFYDLYLISIFLFTYDPNKFFSGFDTSYQAHFWLMIFFYQKYNSLVGVKVADMPLV